MTSREDLQQLFDLKQPFFTRSVDHASELRALVAQSVLSMVVSVKISFALCYGMAFYTRVEGAKEVLRLVAETGAQQMISPARCDYYVACWALTGESLWVEKLRDAALQGTALNDLVAAWAFQNLCRNYPVWDAAAKLACSAEDYTKLMAVA